MCKKQQTWAPHSEPKIDVKNEAIFGFTQMTSRSRLPEIEAKNGLHKTQTIQNEKRCRCAQKKPPTGVPSLFLRIARRTSKHMAHQLKVAILQPAKQDLFLFMPHQAEFNNHRQLLVCHVGTVPSHRLSAWKAACANSWMHRHGAACGKRFASRPSTEIMLLETHQSSDNPLCSNPAASTPS